MDTFYRRSRTTNSPASPKSIADTGSQLEAVEVPFESFEATDTLSRLFEARRNGLAVIKRQAVFRLGTYHLDAIENLISGGKRDQKRVFNKVRLFFRLHSSSFIAKKCIVESSELLYNASFESRDHQFNS